MGRHPCFCKESGKVSSPTLGHKTGNNCERQKSGEGCVMSNCIHMGYMCLCRALV